MRRASLLQRLPLRCSGDGCCGCAHAACWATRARAGESWRSWAGRVEIQAALAHVPSADADAVGPTPCSLLQASLFDPAESFQKSRSGAEHVEATQRAAAAHEAEDRPAERAVAQSRLRFRCSFHRRACPRRAARQDCQGNQVAPDTVVVQGSQEASRTSVAVEVMAEVFAQTFGDPSLPVVVAAAGAAEARQRASAAAVRQSADWAKLAVRAAPCPFQVASFLIGCRWVNAVIAARQPRQLGHRAKPANRFSMHLMPPLLSSFRSDRAKARWEACHLAGRSGCHLRVQGCCWHVDGMTALLGQGPSEAWP